MSKNNLHMGSSFQLFAALRRRPVLWAAFCAFCLCAVAIKEARAQEKLKIDIGYIAYAKPLPPLYDPEAVPRDEGVKGAALAISENNTTGAFTGQSFELTEALVAPGESPVEAARKLADKGLRLFIADLPAAELIQLADALRPSGALVFNASAPDDRLRGPDCRANLFHIAPSRAMLTDGLAQFLLVRRWPRTLLVVGPGEADAAYAAAFRASARKFGLKIVAEKPWTYGPLARARGDNITEAEALNFARGGDYDVIVVADEAADFGDFILYRTADPKLVMGTQGLVTTSWSPVHIAWGAEQLQSRFQRFAGRVMRPVDYQAWMAARAIGDAAQNQKSADPAGVRAFLDGPDFNLANYKGSPGSFRPWDQQLRQVLLYAQPKSIVGVAPQPGFLHQRSVLDTLGADLPETSCHLN
jgi:ABC transporter substrate binding protein (PQQ-dependent alcohol dehydrogenase system)